MNADEGKIVENSRHPCESGNPLSFVLTAAKGDTGAGWPAIRLLNNPILLE